CETLTPDMLRQQFYSLPQPDQKEFVVSADPSNVFKNRYSNIPCLDSTRILLEFLLFEDGGGYIHANRVTYPLLRNEFILTQAPTENAQTMFTLLRRVRGSKTPVVVHCSAGVGRSGTLVALEMCLMTVANTRPIDIHS
ncbi:Protein-tyrosine phosphatase, partial [Teladorsagia circumcincta]